MNDTTTFDTSWLDNWSHLSQKVIDGLIELRINPDTYVNPDGYNWINEQRSVENGAAVVRLDQNTKVDLYAANHGFAITSCILSIIGSSFIIGSFLFFRKRLMDGFHRRIILYLSISDLGISLLHGLDHAVNLAYGYVVPGWYCQLTAWYLGTLLMANQLWLIMLSYYLFKLAVRGDKSHMREQILPLVCWGFPALLHFLPLLGYPGGPLGSTRDEQWGLSYGPREAWCYIRNANAVWLNMFLAVPAVVSFLIVAVLYTFILSTIRRVQAEAGQFLDDDKKKEKAEADRRLQKRLLGYPAIFLIQWVCLVIEFILVWAGAAPKTLVVSDIFTVATINISGFLNCLWFTYNERLIARYRAFFRGEDPWGGDLATVGGSRNSSASTMSTESGQSGNSNRGDRDEPLGFDKPRDGERRSRRSRGRRSSRRVAGGGGGSHRRRDRRRSSRRSRRHE